MGTLSRGSVQINVPMSRASTPFSRSLASPAYYDQQHTMSNMGSSQNYQPVQRVLQYSTLQYFSDTQIFSVNKLPRCLRNCVTFCVPLPSGMETVEFIISGKIEGTGNVRSLFALHSL
ncbi:hypothetical protein J6590_040101 [Homalodisca vitripennis]|nr:hypothetical protein J6590_040101 [Homalodisca vitripennis]